MSKNNDKNIVQRLIHMLFDNSVVRYVFFGGCTTAVNLIVFLVLRFLKVEMNLSNIISIVCAILFAYVVNSRFVFQDHPDTLKDKVLTFCRFIGARLSTMIIEVFGLLLLVRVFHLQEMISKIMIQIIVLVLNYIFSKFLVFRSKKVK